MTERAAKAKAETPKASKPKRKLEPPDQPLDIYKMTINEGRLVQELTGKQFQQVLEEIQEGGLGDLDTLQVLGLVWLRRKHPDATMEEAGDVEFIPMLAGDEDDIDMETAMRQAAEQKAQEQETKNPS